MSEITELFDDVYKQFTDKINELYQQKMSEHKINISTNLSDAYTENYGKFDPYILQKTTNYSFDFSKFIKKFELIEKYIKKNNSDRYIIHFIILSVTYQNSGGGYHSSTTQSYVNLFIDNYGDFLLTYGNNNSDFIEAGFIEQLSNSNLKPIGKYILPNILIDFIKSFNSELHTYNTNNNVLKIHRIFTDLLIHIKIIAEDYYNKFTNNQIISELIENNRKMSEEIIVLNQKLSPTYESQLFGHIKELQSLNLNLKNQLEETHLQIAQLQREKDEIIEKYSTLKGKLKDFLELQ